jgi:hypothetical protein
MYLYSAGEMFFIFFAGTPPYRHHSSEAQDVKTLPAAKIE